MTLEKRVIPGSIAGGGTTVTVNIAFDADPSIDTKDEIRYYYGEDDENAATLKEALKDIWWAGAEPYGPWELYSLNGLAVLGDEVFVADCGNGRVRKFTSMGAFRAATPPGTFDQPYGLCVAGGYLYLAEATTPPDTGAIVKLDPASLAEVARYTDDLLCQPLGVAVDAAGNIYTVHVNDPGVLKRDAATGTWSTWKEGIAGFSVAVSGDGHIYVIEQGVNEYVIRKFSLADGSGGAWETSVPIVQPDGLAVDSANRVYVCDADSRKILRFAADGTLLGQFDSPALFNGAWQHPVAVSDGSVICTASDVAGQVVAIRNMLTFVSDENNRFDGADVEVNITKINGADPAAFAGFDPEEVDSIEAVVTYTLADGSRMSFEGEFEEGVGGEGSRLFTGTISVFGGDIEQPQTLLKTAVADREESRAGFHMPFTLRTRFCGESESLTLADIEFPVEKGADSWWYLKGGSKELLAIVRKTDKWFLVYFDTQNRSQSEKEVAEKKVEATRNEQIKAKASFLFGSIDFTESMRTDPATNERYMYPSPAECQESNGTWKNFIRYNLDFNGFNADDIRKVHFRVRGTKSAIVFEQDITQAIKDSPNLCLESTAFSGLTSTYKVRAVDTQSLDADGEINTIGGKEKFVDPGDDGSTWHTAEIESECMFHFKLEGGASASQPMKIKTMSRFNVKRRSVALVELNRLSAWHWWREENKLMNLLYGTRNTDSQPVLRFYTSYGEEPNPYCDVASFAEAYSYVTPRGCFLYCFHGSIIQNPNNPDNGGLVPGDPPDYGDDGTDLFGFIYMMERQGEQWVPIAYSGFVGNGSNQRTTLTALGELPGHDRPPYSLEEMPRSHGVQASLVSCWSAHKSGWDDSGLSIQDTLWEVLNSKCSSAAVGGSWGLVEDRPAGPTGTIRCLRPFGDDEQPLVNGVKAEGDIDEDRNASTWHDSKVGDGPDRTDPHTYEDNWIVRPPRPIRKQ